MGYHVEDERVKIKIKSLADYYGRECVVVVVYTSPRLLAASYSREYLDEDVRSGVTLQAMDYMYSFLFHEPNTM